MARRFRQERSDGARTELTEHSDLDAEKLTLKRFDVELFIVHPTADPDEISTALGLDPEFAHRIGDQPKSPAGTELPGMYRDTRWRHRRRYETGGQWFADKIVDLIDCLEPHKESLKKLISSGGQACVIVRFMGDGYWGDEVPKDTLSRLAGMDLDLGIECFTVPDGAAEMKNIQVIDGAQNCTFSIFQATREEFSLLFPGPN